MNYTDTQLKRTLAKMLPKLLCFSGDDILYHCQHKDGVYNGYSPEVLDTELLHLCWLVEKDLTNGETADYEKFLFALVDGYLSALPTKQIWNATWQQRVIALAKVKGIEIVHKEYYQQLLEQES